MLEELFDKKHDNLTTVLKEDLAYSLKESHNSLASSLKEGHNSLASSLKEDLASSLKESHNSLASSLKEDLALSLKEGHYSLYSTLNENIDAKFDALMRVALIMGLTIVILIMTVMLLLYRNLIAEKATKSKIEDPQALKMP